MARSRVKPAGWNDRGIAYGVLIPLTRLDCLQLEGRASEAS